MSILHYFKSAVNRAPILQSIYDHSKYFFNIIPFYIAEEKVVHGNVSHLLPRLDVNHLTVGMLNLQDMKTLADNPEVNESEATLKHRLENGWLCIGIRFDGNLAAYNWANLEMCDSRYLNFKLKKNEAYLTYARTFQAYRGKNLAPFLRCKMYEQLRQQGRTRLYSITEYFNAPAIRFKNKLNVRNVKFCIWFCIAKRFERSIIFKTYKKL